jgi:anti-anti-sigma regulatory factor
VARVLSIRDHRIELDIADQPNSHDLSADSEHHVVLFPTRNPPHVPSDHSSVPVSDAGRPQLRVRTRVKHEVSVLEVAGQLSGVVHELESAIRLTLADTPRAVICDLSDVETAEQGAVEVLATAGRHVRDWPGIPIAVACPDPQVRQVLNTHPLGGHLIVTDSVFSATAAVLATPVVATQSLRLAPHPTAPRAAREFVSRALLDWRLGSVTPFASLVVSELVASSTVNAGTDIDLSVAWDPGALRWDLGAVRLTVRDHGPALPGQRPSLLGLDERGLTVVAGLTRAFGALPTSDRGQVVWAVLNTPRPRPPAGDGKPHSRRTHRKSPTNTLNTP